MGTLILNLCFGETFAIVVVMSLQLFTKYTQKCAVCITRLL